MEIPVYENESPVGTLHIFPQGLYTVFETRLPAALPPLPKGGCPVAPTSGRRHTGADEGEEIDLHQPCIKSSQRSALPHLSAALTSSPAGGGTASAPPLTRLWLLDRAGAAAPLGLLEPREETLILRRRLTRLDLRALPARPVRALLLPAHASPSGGGVAAACGGDERGGAATDTPLVSGTPTAPVCALGHLPRRGRQDTPLTPPPKGEARTSPWLSRPDGSLVDPARRLLALPWAGGALPSRARKILINGREYLLFRY